MKAIIYYSMTKKQKCKNIAYQIEGDHFEIEDLHKPNKCAFFRVIHYAYIVIANKDIEFKTPKIDFDQYDEIFLVSPVWGGKICIFMSRYLKQNIFTNKEVTVVSSSIGENNDYLDSVKEVIDSSNKIVKHITYIKGIKTSERKV